MEATASPAAERVPSDDLVIAYVGGGSREWFPRLAQDLALSDLGGTMRLYDHHPESAARNAEFGNWVQARDAATADWTYEAIDDREAALDDADVVLLSTQYNPIDTFVPDLEITRDHGIYHAVGATIGPAGISRALRTVPVYRSIAADVREQCPDAWVFNFTNPVHFVTRALYDEYPEINAVGLCHEVPICSSHLAAIAREHFDMPDATADDISVNVKGINHFTWVDEAYCDGTDLWPHIEAYAESEAANETFDTAALEDVSPFNDEWQVTWELFRRFGVLPYAGDRHIVEYATWFLQDGEAGLNRWGVKRTGADFRSKHWDPAESEQTTDVTAWMTGDREFTLEASDEEFLRILEALAGGDPIVTNVNLPNRGQVEGVEHGAVVETNAHVRAGEVRPLSAGGFPRPVQSLVQEHVNTIETVVEASRDGDLDRAFEGFLIDPQTRALQTEDAAALFRDLVDAERDYLADWNLESASVLDAH